MTCTGARLSPIVHSRMEDRGTATHGLSTAEVSPLTLPEWLRPMSDRCIGPAKLTSTWL